MIAIELFDHFTNITEFYASPLLKGYPLVGDWRKLGVCILGYLYMCFMGPRLMNSRKEFHVKPVMQVYNVFMVALNAWVLYELTVTAWNYNWFCEPHSYEINPHNMRHAFAIWLYYISKMIEFLDTFFFIVRKKTEQVSFLHVYHHSTMCISMWLIASFCPAGDAFFPIYCNAMVHVVMYSYYFIAALGPDYQKYIWWKKHLTKFQIIQFFMIIGQASCSIYVNCNPTFNGYHWYVVGYMISFIILFSHFYLLKYIKGDKSKDKKPVKSE